MFSQKLLWKLVKILSLVGIVLASYLLTSYLRPQTADVCRIDETVNCDAVTQGSLATVFGIPVALIGLTGYLVIFFSSLAKKKSLVLFMAAFGALFCLRITYLELFVVKIICPVCIACQLIMLTIVALALRLNFGKIPVKK
jgi:uncharacterized membrane protein